MSPLRVCFFSNKMGHIAGYLISLILKEASQDPEQYLMWVRQCLPLLFHPLASLKTGLG